MSTFFKNIQVTVAEPTKFDVLCGSKSKAVASHPGNVLLSEQVEESLEAYHQARNKQERITINRSVILFMRKKYQSRFLKQNQDGSWSVAEEQSVRDKVSHAIRHALAKKQKSNASASTSYTLDDIKNYDLHEDAETRMHISLVFDRQQAILASMMQQTGDESSRLSTMSHTSTQGDDLSYSGRSRSSSVTHEDMAGFLAGVL